MADNVYLLSTQSCSDDVIRTAEALMRAVEDGDVVALALVTINRQQLVTSAFADVEVDPMRVVGGLEWLKSRVLERVEPQ